MIDRRLTIKWVLAASVTMPLLASCAGTAGVRSRRPVIPSRGYGADPDLTHVYRPGEMWPLTFTPAQRRTAAALCDVIIPADPVSPSASSVGVVDFIDEWVSAPYPYPHQQEDLPIVIEGLAWMDDEARRRYMKSFADLDTPRQTAICDDIAHERQAQAPFAKAAVFFGRYRDLTAGGFYSTPEGRKDLQYIGNVPLARFEGPSLEILRKVGLGEAPT